MLLARRSLDTSQILLKSFYLASLASLLRVSNIE